MSTVLESNSDTQHIQTQLAARRMRATMAAIKVVFTWLGTTKTLSTDQKTVAADVFGADGGSISASKRLLDPKHPALAAVTKIKGRVTKFWKDNSLPFPEGGIRLIRHDQIAEVPSYDDILKGIRAIVSEGHINLVETLAERIASHCLNDKRIVQVRVRIEKLERGPDAVGVEIVRPIRRDAG